MNKDKSVKWTIESIRIIDEQINFFRKKTILFWNNKKYVNRIEKLETIRGYLYKRLENKLDDE